MDRFDAFDIIMAILAVAFIVIMSFAVTQWVREPRQEPWQQNVDRVCKEEGHKSVWTTRGPICIPKLEKK